LPQPLGLLLSLLTSDGENEGSRPTIRRLSARLDCQDAKVDVRQGLVKVTLRDKRYLLKLMEGGVRRQVEGLGWKKVHLKCAGGGPS
jgi:hypothetical protein